MADEQIALILDWLRDGMPNDLQFIPGRSAEGKVMIVACDDAIASLQSKLDEITTKLDAVQRGYFAEMKRAHEAESRLENCRTIAQGVLNEEARWGAPLDGRGRYQMHRIAAALDGYPPDHQPLDVYGDCRCAKCAR